MTARIPITAASEVGKKHKLRQVILLAFDDAGRTHVVTWGRGIEDCAQAAEGGNILKKKWGWPECNDQPSRVRKLQSQIATLKSLLRETNDVIGDADYGGREHVEEALRNAW